MNSHMYRFEDGKIIKITMKKPTEPNLSTWTIVLFTNDLVCIIDQGQREDHLGAIDESLKEMTFTSQPKA